VQSHASSQFAFIQSEQQAAIGWRIVTWKSGQFLIEILEAQAEAERLRIFEEKFAGLRDLCGRFCWRYRQSRNRVRYPMSIPPFTFST
jgi:hypothetical protein